MLIHNLRTHPFTQNVGLPVKHFIYTISLLPNLNESFANTKSSATYKHILNPITYKTQERERSENMD